MRSVLRVFAATVAATATFFVLATPAQADPIPPGDGCFTVGGTGVCVQIDPVVTSMPSGDDVTLSLAITVTTGCPGVSGTCHHTTSTTYPIDRTGVDVQSVPTVDIVQVSSVSFTIPGICYSLGCTSPQPVTVPVFAPDLSGPAATLWILGYPVSVP